LIRFLPLINTNTIRNAATLQSSSRGTHKKETIWILLNFCCQLFGAATCILWYLNTCTSMSSLDLAACLVMYLVNRWITSFKRMPFNRWHIWVTQDMHGFLKKRCQKKIQLYIYIVFHTARPHGVPLILRTFYMSTADNY